MQAKLSLSETERALAHRFVRQGKAKARTLTRAWTLLKLADGSWSNMAEIGILERNALSRRLQDEAALRLQVVAVETERNAHKHGIAWQFSSHDARVELERLYPVKDPLADGGPERYPQPGVCCPAPGPDKQAEKPCAEHPR